MPDPTETRTEWQVWFQDTDTPLVTDRWDYIASWRRYNPRFIQVYERTVSTTTTPWRPLSADDTQPEPDPDGRDAECVKAWPGCYSGGYDPHCCRFPKSCSC